MPDISFPNWFASTEAQKNFTEFLTPFAGKEELQFLQLGAFTGDASVWLCENILTGNLSTLIDVDTWEGSDEEAHKAMDFAEVEAVYDRKTERFDNITKFKTKTFDFLRRTPNEIFDFIYVDADHTAVGTLLDAELSWPTLKEGGILAFDDYEWSDGKGDAYRPMPGINTFLDRHQNELHVIHRGWQLWVVKK